MLAFVIALAILIGQAIFFQPGAARAGGGPENVLLVVNEDSPSSKLIANHYISLRQIPDRNVVYLTDIPILFFLWNTGSIKNARMDTARFWHTFLTN